MKKKIEDLTIKELVGICKSRSNEQKLSCLGCPCTPICDYSPSHYSKKWLERTVDAGEEKDEADVRLTEKGLQFRPEDVVKLSSVETAGIYNKLRKIEDLMKQWTIKDTETLKVAVVTALQTIAMEDEIGCEFAVLLNAIKNGVYDKEGKFHKQVYLCFIDGEWTIADMQTDCWYPVSGYGKTWALTKEKLL